ncbi:hypothetical protein CUU62_16470 [Pseudomonas sp. WP001]|nr:hypothetical protein CUU62_16470 [Pseudomonas sp. WP001]
MKLNIEINNVQHIQNLKIEIDFEKNGLTCLVGKNGIGKTTLIKSIRNLKIADTFSKMSQPGILKSLSSINYIYGDESYSFTYDPKIDNLDSRAAIPSSLKKAIEVELPFPWGQRFNSFQSISSADNEIRTALMIGEYETPTELIELLKDVYNDNKFDTLKEVKVGRSSYYIVPLGNDRYVREDHLSSGEFFLISLYRKIKSSHTLIVIDEIDISLDAAAQSRLIAWLRIFCTHEKTNILFTTHSMAIMRTMFEHELYYMQNDGGIVTIKQASYNFIKSILFGFDGCDRYILTEDPVLEGLLNYLIVTHNIPFFYKFKIIPIGGGNNVMQLFERNKRDYFFGAPEHVLVILDGDYAEKRDGRKKHVRCIPFDSVEKKIYEDYITGKYKLEKKLEMEPKDDKQLYNALTQLKLATNQSLYKYLDKHYPNEIIKILEILTSFLCRNEHIDPAIL